MPDDDGTVGSIALPDSPICDPIGKQYPSMFSEMRLPTGSVGSFVQINFGPPGVVIVRCYSNSGQTRVRWIAAVAMGDQNTCCSGRDFMSTAL